MASKQIADREKAAKSVLAAVEAHTETLESRLQASLAPHLEKGEKLPSVGLLVAVASRSLRAAADQMVAADKAHERELSDDAGPREARDAAAEKVSQKLVDLKEIVTGLLGASALDMLALTGVTPRDPTQLVHQVEIVVARLREVTLPRSRVPGASLDVAASARDLERAVVPLRQALADVAREAREAEATLVKKHASIESFDATFSQQAGFLSGLLHLAGEHDLAGRIRPATRKAGRVQDAPVGPDADPSG